MDLSRADAVQLDASWKGFPFSSSPCAVSNVGQQGWHALLDLPLPIALLKADSLQRNAAFMRSFNESRGIALAPHAKTSTSLSSARCRWRTEPGD
jgi:D-serine dehydratase